MLYLSLAYHIVRDHTFQENEKHDQEYPLAICASFCCLILWVFHVHL